MKPWLRRFAAVGLLVTALDIGVLLLLARGLDLPVVLADVIALSVAATTSFVLQRLLTFADDPYARWVHLPLAFVATAVVAGLVDVVVLQALVSLRPSTTDWGSCGASCRPLSWPPPCASRPTAAAVPRGPARPQ